MIWIKWKGYVYIIRCPEGMNIWSESAVHKYIRKKIGIPEEDTVVWAPLCFNDDVAKILWLFETST